MSGSALSETTTPADGATPRLTAAKGQGPESQTAGTKPDPLEDHIVTRVCVPAAAAVSASARPSPVTSPTLKRLAVGTGVAPGWYQTRGPAKAVPDDRKTSSRPAPPGCLQRHTASPSPSLSTSPAARRALPAA